MERIIEEGFAVMRAEGHSTHWDDAEGFKEAFYQKMIPPTYVHESSMLQDIRAGRKTEIDFLSGAIVRLGKKHRILTPANELVCSQIKFKEAGSAA
jgi:2-dehydropantoate 2-reductase